MTGEPLGAGYNVSDTYIDHYGEEQIRHKRSAFDATFSAPKSLSELYAHGNQAVQGEVVARSRCGIRQWLTGQDSRICRSSLPDTGLLGPSSFEPDLGLAAISGVMGSQGAVEVLVWDEAAIDRGDETSLGTIELPQKWDPAEEVLVITVTAPGELTVGSQGFREFDIELERLLVAAEDGTSTE